VDEDDTVLVEPVRGRRGDQRRGERKGDGGEASADQRTPA
jgi:hypothetical protein